MEEVKAPAAHKKPESFTKTDYNFASRRVNDVVECIASYIQEEYFLQKLLLEHFSVPHVGRLTRGSNYHEQNPDKLLYDASQYSNYTFDFYYVWSLHRNMGKSALFPIYVELMEKAGYGIKVLDSNVAYENNRNEYQLTKLVFTLTGPKWESRLSTFVGAASSLDDIVQSHRLVDAWRSRDLYNLELAPAGYANHCFYMNGQWYLLKAQPKEEIPNLEIYKFLGHYVLHGDRLETVKKVMNLVVDHLDPAEKRLLVAFHKGDASIPGAQSDLEEEVKVLTEKLTIANGALEQLGKREFIHVDTLIIEHSAKLMSLATSGKVHAQVNRAALALIKIE
jgi:hypothetical protein